MVVVAARLVWTPRLISLTVAQGFSHTSPAACALLGSTRELSFLFPRNQVAGQVVYMYDSLTSGGCSVILQGEERGLRCWLSLPSTFRISLDSLLATVGQPGIINADCSHVRLTCNIQSHSAVSAHVLPCHADPLVLVSLQGGLLLWP